MKIFTIHGSGDDLIETSGIFGCDEFNVILNFPKCKKLQIQSSSGNLNIYCIYDGCWAFAFGAIDGLDCDIFPDWKIKRIWGEFASYSDYVEIEVPDDARLVEKLENFIR